MEITMYDTLLQLPLFQGLGKKDITSIIERVEFYFQSYPANEIIVKQDDQCDQLFFLMQGELEAETKDNTNGYLFSEVLCAPYFVEPYSLFGKCTNYTATYKARTDVKLLTINKSFIFEELSEYPIIRLNFMNILSSRCQTINQKLWNLTIGNANQKFIQFLLHRSQQPNGEKTLKITMEDLAEILNETRINISKMLNDYQNKGLVQLKRKAICIPELSNLEEKSI